MELVNDPATQRTACAALDAVLEILAETIDQYLPLIMERLAGLLETAPIPVKSVIVGAIGSAAHASKEGFLPYFAQTMNRFQHFLVLTGEGEEQELRGITMDAIGTFADAVGKEDFRPYFASMMQQAFAGIELGSARLKECSFLFFGVMARVFAEEFAPYLPQVVPTLYASLKQAEHGDEELETAGAAVDFASGSTPATAITIGDGFDGEDIDVDIDKLLDVNSTICIEKEIAADTIGGLFASTGAQFLPFVEQSTIELVAQLTHYYDGIRKAASESLLEIIRSFYEIRNPAEWQPGQAVPVPLDQQVKDLVEHILPPMFEMYEAEDNK